MSTAIKSSFIDHSGLDGTGDAINGEEVDENPNLLADIMDGTIATDFAGAGTLDFVMTDTRAGIRIIDLSNAAAAIHEGLVLEWDPGDGGNLTDNSSGIGIDFKLPDDADVQTVFGSLNVVCVDDAAASTDGEFSFRVTAAGTDNVEQMTLSAAALTVVPNIIGTIDGTSTLADGVVATTQSASDNSTKVATTAYADAAGITFNNDGNNRIVTGDGSGGLNGEANLTFDGTTLAVTGGMTLSSTSTISGDMTFNDNVNLTFGTGGDADIDYDGSNLIINPRVVGTGDVQISSGRLTVGGTSTTAEKFNVQDTADGITSYIENTHATFTSRTMQVNVTRAASTAYSFIHLYSGAGADKEFDLRGDGSGFADTTWTTPAADVGEYFESLSGAAMEEGRTVVLVGEYIDYASNHPGVDPIGVVRPEGTISFLGNNHANTWKRKYLRDDFGDYQRTEDGERILNPDYDEEVDYIPYEDRAEKIPVGQLGQVPITVGEPVNDRWVKMKDISADVELWYVR